MTVFVSGQHHRLSPPSIHLETAVDRAAGLLAFLVSGAARSPIRAAAVAVAAVVAAVVAVAIAVAVAVAVGTRLCVARVVSLRAAVASSRPDDPGEDREDGHQT